MNVSVILNPLRNRQLYTEVNAMKSLACGPEQHKATGMNRTATVEY